MLKIENVSKRFRAGNFGVRDLSLEVKSGVIGLLGPNGAGKTTLMQIIATITRPTSGRILFHGQDIAKRPNELRRQLGYLPQDFGVYDNLSRAEEPLRCFDRLKGWIQRGHGPYVHTGRRQRAPLVRDGDLRRAGGGVDVRIHAEPGPE